MILNKEDVWKSGFTRIAHTSICFTKKGWCIVCALVYCDRVAARDLNSSNLGAFKCDVTSRSPWPSQSEHCRAGKRGGWPGSSSPRLPVVCPEVSPTHLGADNHFFHSQLSGVGPNLWTWEAAAFIRLSSLTWRSLGSQSPASVLHQLPPCRPRVRRPLLSGAPCVTGPRCTLSAMQCEGAMQESGKKCSALIWWPDWNA